MKANPHVLPKFDPSNGLEFGLYTLGEHVPDPHTGKQISAQERIKQMIEMAQLAEQAGMDIFQLGESHQEYFAISNAVPGQGNPKLRKPFSFSRLFSEAQGVDNFLQGDCCST